MSLRPTKVSLVTIMVVATACGQANQSASPPASAPSSPAATTSAAPASSAPASSAPATGGTLTAHLYQAFTSFYPWSESGTGGDSIVTELQWDQLAAYDDKGSPSMRLADSIEPNADATTWTVKLKPGITGSDGTPFTSKDVIFTWKLNASPNHSPNAALWTEVTGVKAWQDAKDFAADIPGITAPHDSTVFFQLDAPNAAFLSTLLNFRNYILPEKAILSAAP